MSADPRQYDQLFAALMAPFEAEEVKARSQSGRSFQYVTARVCMNRLDDVLGPANWWDRYIPGENSVMCELTIRLPDGTTLTKSDAGGYAGMADSGDDDKSGFSDAFKRACAKLGVGRYLYRDGVPRFAREQHGEVPNDPAARHEPRREPSDRPGGWAGSQNAAGRGSEPPRGRQDGQPPRSGKALFAFCKEQEQRHDVGLIRFLQGWAKLQGFPEKMVNWNAEEVKLGYEEACRKLQSIPASHDGAYEQALAN